MDKPVYWEHIDPFTGNMVSNGRFHSSEEVRSLLEKQRIHLARWKQLSVQERIEVLRPLISFLEQEKENWAIKATVLMGKPYQQSIAEVEKCLSLLHYYFEHSVKALSVQKMEIPGAEVQMEGLGVILGVMPWNFPYWQVFRYAIPALISGNLCVLKHAPNTFECGDLIQDAFDYLKHPNLLLNIKIDHQQCAEFIASGCFQGLSFTGSEKAGRILGGLAGKALIPSVLELGGNNTFFVDADADLDLVVKEAINSRLQNNGQSCIAAKRFFIHESMFEAFKLRLNQALNSIVLGDPKLTEVFLGPIARLDLAEELERQVSALIKDGAKELRPFTRTDAMVYPCLLEVDKQDDVFQAIELFGPVFVLCAVASWEEMITLSNRSPYGLGAMVYTGKSKKEIAPYLRAFDEGSVFVNHFSKSHPALPFGGVKASGYGRELGIEGLFSFVNKKLIWIAD